jgi:uncharacterized protein YehS (DUF1456 family)
MTNNDVLRCLRYCFDFDDAKMVAVFAAAECVVSTEQIVQWLKKEEDPEFSACSDEQLATFLNGLINDKRGKKDGPQPVPETKLTNNIIFLKLKIALDMQAEEVLEILNLADLQISKHELSAFFRKPDNKRYRECKDEILRDFLAGIQRKYRDNVESNSRD